MFRQNATLTLFFSKIIVLYFLDKIMKCQYTESNGIFCRSMKAPADHIHLKGGYKSSMNPITNVWLSADGRARRKGGIRY